MRSPILFACSLPILCVGALAQAPGAHWTAATTGGVTDPPVRIENPGAADYAHMYVFGGRTGTGTRLNDLWTFDGTTWTHLAPAGPQPGQRRLHHLVTRLDYGDVLAFGGYNTAAANRYTDIWRWNGGASTWTQIVTATLPTHVFVNDATYDLVRKRVVMVGGHNVNNNPGGMHNEFDSLTNDWVLRPLDSVVGKPTRFFLAFIPTLGKTYKASGQINPDKTYEYQSDVVATFASTTPGCATSAGVPDLDSPSLPWIARDFVLQVTNTPASSATVIAFDAAPLAPPFPMSAIGIGPASCVVTVNPLLNYVAPPDVMTGLPTLTIPIPNVATLVGGPVVMQAFVVDFGAAQTYVSNRGDAVMGAL